MKKADLDALLEHWGGLVPNGHRGLWLHVYACAMAWIDPAADIADASVAKAASVAPGLDPREVRRVIAPTARRASRAANGSRTPDGKDPRYDYGGTRLAEIFDVDEDLAERLGLRQIIPPATRAERNGRRRVKRRRAAGALPRALWLALNPISREAPWLAEGVSRATWYRRRRRYREERLQARIGALFGGAAVISGDFETGAATLYRGEAPPGATAPRPEPADHASDGPQDAHGGPNPPKTTRQPQNATRPPQIRGVSRERPADPVPQRHPTQPPPKEIDMSAAILSRETLLAAEKNLSATDLGVVVRLGLALADGPMSRSDLARRARIDIADLDRLDPWLRAAPDSRKIAGVTVPCPRTARKPRAPRQAQMFSGSEFILPEPRKGSGPEGVRAGVISAGIRILGRGGVGESDARKMLGMLLKRHGLGPVTQGLDDVDGQGADVADPRSYLIACIRRRTEPSTGVPEGRARVRRGDVTAMKDERPIATPEFLGISEGLADRIRKRNADLTLPLMRRPGSHG